jgi:hypothetical protein
MKFGIFYELQLPRPWGPDSELTLYHNALDQLGLADRLGYDFAWEVEHHFLEEYSHSPAPEVFLAAASQRTRQIRLAHGIMQLTTVHPARVAERIVVLDLVSRGRVEFGMGESASITDSNRSNAASTKNARSGRTLSAPSFRCSRMAAANTTAPISISRCAMSWPSHCRSRIRRYGSRARRWTRSRWPGAVASARSPSSS